MSHNERSTQEVFRDQTDPVPEVRVPPGIACELLVAVALLAHATWRWFSR